MGAGGDSGGRAFLGVAYFAGFFAGFFPDDVLLSAGNLFGQEKNLLLIFCCFSSAFFWTSFSPETKIFVDLLSFWIFFGQRMCIFIESASYQNLAKKHT